MSAHEILKYFYDLLLRRSATALLTQLYTLPETVIIQPSHLGKTALTVKPGCSQVRYFPFILNLVHL